MESQISNLQASHVTLLDDTIVKICHDLHFTMADGKIIHTITGTAFSVCYLCGALPTQRQDLQAIMSRPVKPGTASFGISALHAWIRCCKFLLKLGYTLTLKKPTVRGHDKVEFRKRKRRIQMEIQDELGLIVDQP